MITNKVSKIIGSVSWQFVLRVISIMSWIVAIQWVYFERSFESVFVLLEATIIFISSFWVSSEPINNKRISLRTIGLLLSVCLWSTAIIWLFVANSYFEPILSFLGGASTFVVSFLVSNKSFDIDTARRKRNEFLDKVEEIWIEGDLRSRLEQSLGKLSLNIEEIDDLSISSQSNLQHSDNSHYVSVSNSIVPIFEKRQRRLLILGEPGAGKTVTLLELAQELLIRAQDDNAFPIPVVLNLASWSNNRLPIEEWIVKELEDKYRERPIISKAWLKGDQLLLLLDGLDEVLIEHREECVSAINLYAQNSWTGIVVCCRTDDYTSLSTPLAGLNGCVILQKLTPTQIETYLLNGGDDLKPIQTAIENDKELQQFFQTPLHLAFAAEACRDLDLDKLSTGSFEERREYLIEVYLNRAFEQITGYSQKDDLYQQSLDWVQWLSKKVLENNMNRPIFRVDMLQPTWLFPGFQRWIYLFASRIACALVITFISIVVLEFRMFDSVEVIRSLLGKVSLALRAGLQIGITLALLDGLQFERIQRYKGEKIPYQQYIQWFLLDIFIFSLIIWYFMTTEVSDLLSAFILFGLVIAVTNAFLIRHKTKILKTDLSSWSGLLIVLQIGWMTFAIAFVNFDINWSYSLAFSVSFGLLFGLRNKQRRYDEDIQPVSTLVWEWSGVIIGIKRGFVIGMICGLLLAIGVAPLFQAIYEVIPTNYSELLRLALISIMVLAVMLLIGCIGSLIGGLLGGIKKDFINFTKYPNLNNRLLFRNVVALMLGLGFCFAVFMASVEMLVTGDEISRNFMITIGIFVGMLSGISFGGIDLLYHYALRFVLLCTNRIPVDYPDFLDRFALRTIHHKATIFHKASVGYIFSHPLLLDHLSKLEPVSEPVVDFSILRRLNQVLFSRNERSKETKFVLSSLASIAFMFGFVWKYSSGYRVWNFADNFGDVLWPISLSIGVGLLCSSVGFLLGALIIARCFRYPFRTDGIFNNQS